MKHHHWCHVFQEHLKKNIRTCRLRLLRSMEASKMSRLLMTARMVAMLPTVPVITVATFHHVDDRFFFELEEDKGRKLHWHHKWQEITIDELGLTLLCQLHAHPPKSEHHTSLVEGPFPLLHLITTTTIIISINIINPLL